MSESFHDAERILSRVFGYPAFRPAQANVVRATLNHHDVLAVLPTGGGKSLCFQVPALLHDGVTLVISPLIALMQDQVHALRAKHVAAAALNGTVEPDAQRRILADAAAGRLKLLYTSPERLARLATELVDQRIRIARLAVDEAHCIVEWGHDFRPSYRALRTVRSTLGNPPCIALTGSATPAVRREIQSALGFSADRAEITASFDRPNLRFDVRAVSGREDRLARVTVLVRTTAGTSIVYAPTRGMTEGLARVLRESGVTASPYHAGMETAERNDVLQRFMSGELRTVVATCAFGMGIDKPDVRLVAHWTMPSTPESYYQEAGRAGRDGNRSRCVLFHHPADALLPRRQIGTTFPREQLLEALWADPSQRARHPAAVIAAADRLAAELHPERGAVEWSGVRRRRREAERRLAAMMAFAEGRGCRRRALLDWFGERVEHCSGCDHCSSAAATKRSSPRGGGLLWKLVKG